MMGSYFVPLQLPPPASNAEVTAALSSVYDETVQSSKCGTIGAVLRKAVDKFGPQKEDRVRPFQIGSAWCEAFVNGPGPSAFVDCLGSKGAECAGSRNIQYCSEFLRHARECVHARVDEGLAEIPNFTTGYQDAQSWLANSTAV
jgi:hypothetical protein